MRRPSVSRRAAPSGVDPDVTCLAPKRRLGGGGWALRSAAFADVGKLAAENRFGPLEAGQLRRRVLHPLRSFCPLDPHDAGAPVLSLHRLQGSRDQGEKDQKAKHHRGRTRPKPSGRACSTYPRWKADPPTAQVKVAQL